MALSKKELKELEIAQAKKPIKTEYGYRYEKAKTLQEHFNKCKTKNQTISSDAPLKNNTHRKQSTLSFYSISYCVAFTITFSI